MTVGRCVRDSQLKINGMHARLLEAVGGVGADGQDR